VSAAPSRELRRALSFLESDLDPETVIRAGYGAGLVVALSAAVGLLFASLRPRPLSLLVILVAAALAVHAVHWAPRYLARLRRATALGDAPGLIGRAVLRMRIDPTVERAADFAAEADSGPLADSLAAHARSARGRPEAGLTAFGRTWGEFFPELRRATGLLAAAAAEPPGDRARTLDRALDTVLEGTEDRMASFAGSISGPTTALYAFGVLLPLALVAVLPAARVAGVPVSVAALAVVYDGLLPAGLLARRPVAFRPPRVPRSHPAVPDRRWPVVAVAALGVGAGAALARWSAFGWAAPLVSVALGLGGALVAWYRPVLSVRRRARAVEDGLTDAAHLIGSRVRDGESVESAVAAAATEVPGETGAVLAEAAAVADRLRLDVRGAFLGDHGALATVPSPRARSVAALFALAGREGRPAGRALVATAGHLDDLASVEAAARRELAQVTGTLRSTALAFGPLVAGATVAMATGLEGGGGFGGDPLPTAGLGLAVGAYVLLLSGILAGLAAALSAGLDRALIGYRIGRALCVGAVVYLGSFVGTGVLL
jgi:Flp pilus assembly protein TadB